MKSKGLLSMMLSLPDEWNYSTRGLAAICKEGVDAIGTSLKELEASGYIKRRQLRGKDGRITDTEYTIYEQPQKQDTENPHTENPYADVPGVGSPRPENPAEININITTTQKSKKDSSSTHSFSRSCQAPYMTDGMSEISEKREEIKERIDYDLLCTNYQKQQVDELVEIMVEVAANHSAMMRLGRDADYPTAYIQNRFDQLCYEHIEKVLDGISENTTRVMNTKAYLLAALFNAGNTIDNHYTMLVNHDMSQCN